jgi:hypothetical protein
VAQADADENGGPRLTSAEKKELAELRRKNRSRRRATLPQRERCRPHVTVQLYFRISRKNVAPSGASKWLAPSNS